MTSRFARTVCTTWNSTGPAVDVLGSVFKIDGAAIQPPTPAPGSGTYDELMADLAITARTVVPGQAAGPEDVLGARNGP